MSMTEQARAAFEKYFFGDRPQDKRALERSGDGYKFIVAQSAWVIWEAAWLRTPTAEREPNVPEINEKATFELWAERNGLLRNEGGMQYSSQRTEAAWGAWRARASLAARAALNSLPSPPDKEQSNESR